MFPKMLGCATAAALLSLLTACHADNPADSVRVDVATMPQHAATVVTNTAVTLSAAVPPALVRPAPLVTESERRAEELRLVDYEQAYSIEMNRLAQEQAERARRSAVALQAGIVQGPGCEGTEGYAAQECERSLY